MNTNEPTTSKGTGSVLALGLAAGLTYWLPGGWVTAALALGLFLSWEAVCLLTMPGFSLAWLAAKSALGVAIAPTPIKAESRLDADKDTAA